MNGLVFSLRNHWWMWIIAQQYLTDSATLLCSMRILCGFRSICGDYILWYLLICWRIRLAYSTTRYRSCQFTCVIVRYHNHSCILLLSRLPEKWFLLSSHTLWVSINQNLMRIHNCLFYLFLGGISFNIGWRVDLNSPLRTNYFWQLMAQSRSIRNFNCVQLPSCLDRAIVLRL
jgi:hypothetical protein